MAILFNKLIPIFVEQGGMDLMDFNWKLHQLNIPDNHKICFFFGNESHGIDFRFISCLPIRITFISISCKM